jgi:hypothetical protein
MKQHSNNHFQLVQGYLALSSDVECLSKMKTDARMSQLSSSGMGLGDWQARGVVYDRNGLAKPLFSSQLGFNRVDMQIFLSLLNGFVINPRFDSLEYEDMFGVAHPGGRCYWPALAHRELTDSYIEGHGDRCVANAIEMDLMGPQKPSSGTLFKRPNSLLLLAP